MEGGGGLLGGDTIVRIPLVDQQGNYTKLIEAKVSAETPSDNGKKRLNHPSID